MSENKQKTVYIIDGSYFLYRAFYALKPLTAPNGQTVQAVYGFCRMIKKLIDQYQPASMILVWDSKSKTARHEMFEQYKAQRDVIPNDFIAQKELIKQFADVISLRQEALEGSEADDIIASIARLAQDHGFASIIISADKDMRQLTQYGCVVYDPFLEKMLDAKAVEELYGFSVDRLPLYYALLGDASDNIPGVRGIGKKGAQKIAQQFATLEELYAGLDQLAPKTKMLLESARAEAFLSSELFKLRTVFDEYDFNQSQFDPLWWDKAQSFFAELNFKSLLKPVAFVPQQMELEFGGITSQITAPLQSEVEGELLCVRTEADLQKLLDEFEAQDTWALDTETTGLDRRYSKLVGVSLCARDGQAWYVPLAHQTGEQQISFEVFFKAFDQIFKNKKYRWIMHNAKFDMHVLQSAGFVLFEPYFDTMIAAHLLGYDDISVGLKELSERILKTRMSNFGEIVSKVGAKDFSGVPLDVAVLYAAADALQTYRLWLQFKQPIADKGFLELFYEFEMPLVRILTQMESDGILLNSTALRSIGKRMSDELDVVRHAVVEMLGPVYCGLNLNSPKQLQQLLYVDLGIKPLKKTAKKSGFSTDYETLTTLIDAHPIVSLIMRYRELQKLVSTYVEGLLGLCDPETSKIYTNFSQVRVATGRLASSDPNMQNVPTDAADKTLSIRSVFIAREGYSFLSADYSQIELRVLAQLSADATLRQAFLQGQDVHALTASGVFDIPGEQVSREQRQIAKRINFGILYGQTAHGLAKELGIGMHDAQIYLDRYWTRYPGVRQWVDGLIETVKKTGYVSTYHGRRRAVPGIYEANKNLFSAAVRIVMNTPCQGTAAEIIKRGMIRLDAEFKQQNFGARMLLQIHDELVFEIADAHVERVCELVKKTLESVEPTWDVPLIVSTKVGKNWQEASK